VSGNYSIVSANDINSQFGFTFDISWLLVLCYSVKSVEHQHGAIEFYGVVTM